MWSPEVADTDIPDADLMYPGEVAGPEVEPQAEAASVYEAGWSGTDEDSAVTRSRGVLAAASCGSGFTGLSLALVGLCGLAIWAWRHGGRLRRCDTNVAPSHGKEKLRT